MSNSAAQWPGLFARIKAATTRAGRAASREFSIEGTRLFERGLRANAPIVGALADQHYGQKPRERAVLEELAQRQVQLVLVPDEISLELTGGRTFGSIVGLVGLEPSGSEATLPRDGDILVAVDVQDPGNVGALIRTAAAAGASAWVAVGSTDPYHPKAIRTSMGSLFKIPILERATPGELFAELAGTGHSSLATVPREGVQPWSPELASGPWAVFVGSEAHGLPESVQAACSACVSLPQRDDLDSYSVNAAAAMMLYELTRRRADAPGQ